MLDRKSLVDSKSSVAVKVLAAVDVQLGAEEIALCGRVVGDNVLAAGKGRYCTTEKQDRCKHQGFHREEDSARPGNKTTEDSLDFYFTSCTVATVSRKVVVGILIAVRV